MQDPHFYRATLSLFFALVACVSAFGDAGKHKFKSGRAIFSYEWKSLDDASAAGDGLGPMYNDVSCVACHYQGGIGGGGDIEKNAVLITLDPPKHPGQVFSLQQEATALHPGFLTKRPGTTQDKRGKVLRSSGNGRVPQFFMQSFNFQPKPTESFGQQFQQMTRAFDDNMEQMSKSIFGTFQTSMVLHKSSTEAGYDDFLAQLSSYEMPTWGEDLDDAGRQRLIEKLSAQPTSAYRKNNIRFVISQRNSPALFGVGKIDRVPEGLLDSIAKRQRERGKVSGRVARLRDGVGKFGWKGQTASLSAFVRDACANELGLHVPGARQARNAMRPLQEPTGYDVDAKELRMLTKYVSSLPSPRVNVPTDEDARLAVRHGKHVFSKAGCNECHIENLRSKRVSIRGIYSDLLLHDMGQELADPVPSADESGQTVGGAYTQFLSAGRLTTTGFGEAPPTNPTLRRAHARVAAKQREWRTPPLWGVSATAPYLHDGRATTLEEAILAHGGEGTFSAKAYQALSAAQQSALLQFLEALAPPAPDDET